MTNDIQQILKNKSFYLRLYTIAILVSLPIGILGINFFPVEYVLMLFGLIILAPVGILLVLRPQILLIISVFFFPIESANFFDAILPGGLTISKVIGTLLISALIFNIVFRRQKFHFFDDTLDYFVVLFGVALLISSITSFHIDQIMGEADRVFRLILFYIAVKNLASNPRIFYTLLLGWYLASLLASIVGIHDAMTVVTEYGKSTRAAGINGQPNNFALFSLIVTPIGYYFMMAARKLWTKFFYIASLFTIVCGIILSGSRSGMIGLFVITLLILLQHPKRVQLLLAISVLFAFSYPFWPENVQSRYLGSSGDFQDEYSLTAQASTDRRASYITYGLELIAKKPLIGSGYRSFEQLYPLSEYAFYDNPLSSHETFRVAHNIYLETAVGMGLVGLTALIGMLISAWRSFNRTGRIFASKTIPWATAKALEFSIIGFSINSFFVSSEQFKELWLLLGMSSALLYYSQNMSKQVTDSTSTVQSN